MATHSGCVYALLCHFRTIYPGGKCDVFEKSERYYEWFCIQHLCQYAKNSCCLYKEKEGMKVGEFSLEIFFYFRD